MKIPPKVVNYMVLPDKIAYYIEKKCGKSDSIGMSGAAVYLYDDMVLKVQKISEEAENEWKMLKWLDGKLPVPKIIEQINTNKLSYLLMSKCPGEAACSDSLMGQPDDLVQLISKALNQMWDIQCDDCPVNATLEMKLQQAENRVSNGLVDVNDCEPETFGKNGFRDPEALLHWLQTNQPEEEPVLSHGDFCLPNLFFNNGELSGLIDLGRSGVADKWCDIAIGYRSLKHNYDGVYTGVKEYHFDEAHFFDALNIKPDWERIRYYLLLDELF